MSRIKYWNKTNVLKTLEEHAVTQKIQQIQFDCQLWTFPMVSGWPVPDSQGPCRWWAGYMQLPRQATQQAQHQWDSGQLGGGLSPRDCLPTWHSQWSRPCRPIATARKILLEDHLQVLKVVLIHMKILRCRSELREKWLLLFLQGWK